MRGCIATQAHLPSHGVAGYSPDCLLTISTVGIGNTREAPVASASQFLARVGIYPGQVAVIRNDSRTPDSLAEGALRQIFSFLFVLFLTDPLSRIGASGDRVRSLRAPALNLAGSGIG